MNTDTNGEIRIDAITAELRDRAQWVLWKTVQRDGKPTKVPCQTNGQEAKSNEAATWSSFEAVVKRYQAGGYGGSGYVFSEHDEYVGVDLDGCRDPKRSSVLLALG